MLTHSIIVFKAPPAPGGTLYIPPESKKRAIYTQEDYDAWLAKQLPIGTIVCYNVNSDNNITTPHMISVVVDIKKDITEVLFDQYTGEPRSHLLVQIGSCSLETSWCRWGVPTEHREISFALSQRLVNDNVLNYIKNITPEQAKARVRNY